MESAGVLGHFPVSVKPTLVGWLEDFPHSFKIEHLEAALVALNEQINAADEAV
ncbi:MAG: hypothetical protein P8Y42_21450 [Exilibacterium sp.]